MQICVKGAAGDGLKVERGVSNVQLLINTAVFVPSVISWLRSTVTAGCFVAQPPSPSFLENYISAAVLVFDFSLLLFLSSFFFLFWTSCFCLR